jgi:hypothetical protein
MLRLSGQMQLSFHQNSWLNKVQNLHLFQHTKMTIIAPQIHAGSLHDGAAGAIMGVSAGANLQRVFAAASVVHNVGQ